MDESGNVQYMVTGSLAQTQKSHFSLLIYDSARSHLTDEVKSLVNKHSKIAVIPVGLTKKLQPLD